MLAILSGNLSLLCSACMTITAAIGAAAISFHHMVEQQGYTPCLCSHATRRGVPPVRQLQSKFPTVKSSANTRSPDCFSMMVPERLPDPPAAPTQRAPGSSTCINVRCLMLQNIAKTYEVCSKTGYSASSEELYGLGTSVSIAKPATLIVDSCGESSP